ncbi:MAG: hypothetical protein IJ428_05860 [Clostridia bacterium]|nr:hypothetical protein [Clostridia bacterium]
MTLRELSQLYHLNREIAIDRERLAKLCEKASAPTSPNLTGISSGGGNGDRIGSYAAEIADIKKLISDKLKRCLFERDKLERYIADIPDSLTRQIFTLRFINGLSWSAVASRVGGCNSEAGVKMICYRYMRKK